MKTITPIYLLAVIVLSFAGNAFGQSNTATSKEAEITLSIDQFISLVSKYHPIAKQADIQIGQAKQEVRIARGAFDPTFSYQTAEKTFDGTNYYIHQQPVITIPTWFGVTIQSGLERVDGNRVNPTETMGRSSFLGVQIPIGRDLLTDKRRTDLQKAKIIREASTIEKRKIINDLLLEATNSYWDWWLQNRIVLITGEALSVKKKRLEFVKLSVRGGDRPAIDTIEAFAQVQLFELLYNQARVMQQKSQWELSQFIWQENQSPYLLPENCLPALNQFESFNASQNLPRLDSMLIIAKNSHPELLLYTFKLSSLEIEKKYRTQQLLPKATFNYKFLDKGFQWTSPKTTLFENNYQYGVALNIPLRLSTERGEFKKVKYSIQSTTLEQDLKQLQIENKIKATYFEVENLKQQLTVQQNILSNYQTLLRGEELRFRIGESSLFLVNARESKVWETAQKLEELKAKYVMATQKLRWSSGQLN